MTADEPSVSVEELERRMRPGGFSQGGFLGSGERLDQVLAADARTLVELGLSGADLTVPLERLLDAAEADRRRRVKEDGSELRIEVFTGFQICPWAPSPNSGQCTAGGGVRHASVDWRLQNRRTGEQLAGPGLIVHLIRDHGFFEGLESPYRVDPRDLARVLAVGPFA
jgi:hypothetical protein